VILVVEGPSAAGKTTWLSRCDPKLVVVELGRIEPPHQSAREKAQFWSDLNAARWDRTLTVEASHSCALCDTDPLKLHYDYCRARAGVVAWSLFEAGVEACGVAIAERRLGIADLILCAIPDVETLDARQQGDATRTRRNFDLHREFGPALRDWYRTLETLDPGRVEWTFPATVPRTDARDRYNVELFKSWMSDLPCRPTPVP
jgi:hypothetical protein